MNMRALVGLAIVLFAAVPAIVLAQEAPLRDTPQSKAILGETPQSEAPLRETPLLAGAIADREQELKVIEENLAQGLSARDAIDQEIAALGADRDKISRDLVATTARIRAAEDLIAAAKERFDQAATQENALQRSLDARRDVITDVLAALQRIGRRPPPAVLVQPDDMLKSVRAGILMGAVVPELQADALQLATDLAALAAARKAKDDERAALIEQRRAVLTDQTRLESLVTARQNEIAQRQQQLQSEDDKTQALAAQAKSLKELIARLETDDSNAEKLEAASARVPNASPAPDVPPENRQLKPRVAFQTLRSALVLPVSGSIIKHFGSPDGTGGTEKGVTISTPVSAIVTAPADALVSFAGPYRSFGTLLILNAGGGYHLVLIGMNRVSVRTGQFVLAGEPIGSMGGGAARTAASRIGDLGATSAGDGGPSLYIEVRKDGAPIDSRSWWLPVEKAKARG